MPAPQDCDPLSTRPQSTIHKMPLSNSSCEDTTLFFTIFSFFYLFIGGSMRWSMRVVHGPGPGGGPWTGGQCYVYTLLQN